MRFCRGGKYDRLQDLVFDRRQIDLQAMRLAHPKLEGAVLVEGQSFGVGRQVRVVDGRDWHANLRYCLNCQGVEGGSGEARPRVEQVDL